MLGGMDDLLPFLRSAGCAALRTWSATWFGLPRLRCILSVCIFCLTVRTNTIQNAFVLFSGLHCICQTTHELISDTTQTLSLKLNS